MRIHQFQAGIVAEDSRGLVHRHRVVRCHGGAAFPQSLDQHAAGRVAHVVGVGLEGEAPQGDVPAAKVVAESGGDLVEQHFLLTLVSRFHGIQDFQLAAVFRGGALHGLHVLGETGTAITATGVEKMVADARVGADAVANVLDVRTHFLGQQGQLVHERDARGEHGVGGVLGELGGLDVHHDQAVVVAVEGRVQRAHQLHGTGIVGTEHDAVGAHEIVHRSAFFQKFWIRGDAEFELGATLAQFFLDCGTDFIGSSHRHRGLVHNHLVFLHVSPDGARGGDHVLQVGGAVLVRRRAHGDELDRAMLCALGHVGGKTQAACLHIAPDHIFQARFKNRDAALLEDVDLVGIHVQTQYVVAHFRQAGACHQAHIAGADHANFHCFTPLISKLICCKTRKGSAALVMGRPITR